MKLQMAISFFAIALALSAGAQAPVSGAVGVTGPDAAAVSQGAKYLPTVTGPIYEVPPQNTPPPANQGTSSGATTSPSYAPVYMQNSPLYVTPAQNTPPPTTPGANP